MNIRDKAIVVTGAGRGLGLAIAQTLAANGARLALVDIDNESLAQAEVVCQKAGAAQARSYAVNVTDEQAVEQLFEDVARHFGGVDGLVNNAGVTRDALLIKVKEGKVTDKMSSQDWDTVMAVDLRSVFLCAREAAIRMVEQQSAEPAHGSYVIVNISSISRAGNIGQTNYAAAKAGVVAMTTTWAEELARYGIRVGAIAPGFCDTRLVANMKEKPRERLKEKIPLKRLGDPDEIAQTVLFIFQNEFFNGRVIEVDGGMRL